MEKGLGASVWVLPGSSICRVVCLTSSGPGERVQRELQCVGISGGRQGGASTHSDVETQGSHSAVESGCARAALDSLSHGWCFRGCGREFPVPPGGLWSQKMPSPLGSSPGQRSSMS